MSTEAESLLSALELSGIALGLDRVRRILGALGNPQEDVPSVLVAGTNGKGSTASLLASMGRLAGYRTGLFTSPHLESVHERLRIDGESLADADLATYLRRVIEPAAGLGLAAPTYFEALALAAYLAFAERGVELAIVEVGLGGRLDATNVGEPVASAITSIGLDHEAWLGSSLVEIAAEKAEVLRSGRPAIVRIGDPQAREVVRARAEELGAVWIDAASAASTAAVSRPADRPQVVDLETNRRSYRLKLQLAGAHQLSNLSVAVLTAEALASAGWDRLDGTAIHRGAAACRWPGRLEHVDLPDGRTVLLDAAHNPDGAHTLAAYLSSRAAPYDLLFGALAEKRVGDMLPPLARGARRITLTRPPQRRGQAEPASWLPLLGDREAEIEIDPERALDLALASSRGTLVISGSIYLLGRLRPALRRRFGVPPPP